MSMIGKSLIHYEITSQLGKGGMGEVYQAKDTRLGRDVAIKILPEEFARDVDRVARFQREAKLLASLNHPNIAAIYGLEEADGTNFLVMELIKGNTLADRIKTGPIPVEEALKLALQIAEALEAAHEKGVIHRDLKPANIKITPEGKIKILDFGLAKAFAEDEGEEKPLDSPTLSDAATRQGVILGTAAYMSPEQARGKPVDKRADIWAFGVILFEMLTGRALFEGEDVTSTLARVLERQPDYSKLSTDLHPRIRFLLERCLEKDAGNRYHHIADARVDIQKVLADPSGIFSQPLTTMRPRKKLQVGLWIAGALVLVAMMAGFVVWHLKPTEPHKTTRSSHYLEGDQQFDDSGGPILAVSPDGNQFVYATNKGLYIRSIDEFDARLIKGISGGLMFPYFSPDGQWIVYCSVANGLANRRLEKIAVNGGVAMPLCDTGFVTGVFWNIDNTIIYREQGTGVLRISANGGKPEVIIRSKEDIFGPQLLPDGNSVIFTILTNEGYKTVVQSLKSDERKELPIGFGAFYLPTGHIVYGLDNALYAAAFDLNSLKITREGVPLIQELWATTYAQFAVSASGTLVYIPEPKDTGLSGQILVWVDRQGNEEPIPAPSKNYTQPSVSPNGDQIALTILTGGNADIWIWDSVRESQRRLTTHESFEFMSLWSPDSNRILFSSSRHGGYKLFSRAADGTGEDNLVYSAGDKWIFPGSWSDNGKNLICNVYDNSNYDIFMLSFEGDGKLKPLIKSKSNEGSPIISPDGRYMAYMSNETDHSEVYVCPFPEVDKQKIQISTNGGRYPLWSPDGKEVFYRDGKSVIAVSVETETELRAGKPNTLFPDNYLLLKDSRTWSINPKTGKFLMMKEPQMNGETSPTGPRKINIVTNWDEELKEKVPVD